MKWLLLVLSLILISPLSAASWENSALPPATSDSLVILASDCVEFTLSDIDLDNDDADTVSDPLLASGSPALRLTIGALHYRSQARPGYAIRAPPHL